MKICAYIAGDNNIVLQSIVALYSIKKENVLSSIDLFLCCYENILNETEKKYLKKYEINIIDISTIYVDKFTSVNTMQSWPKEIFSNYFIPLFLNDKGYDYAIKVDYDVLCLAKYNFNDILPKYEELLSVRRSIPLKTALLLVDKKFPTCKKYIDEYFAPNCGFIVINIKSYLEHNFLERFIKLYNYASAQSLAFKHPLEEIVVGLMQLELKLKFREIDIKYNYTTLYNAFLDNKVINIHYNEIKPWKKYNTNIILSRIKSNNFNVVGNYFSLNIWLNYIKDFDFKNSFEINHPYSPIDQSELVKDIIRRIVLEKNQILFWKNIVLPFYKFLPDEIEIQEDFTKKYIQFYIKNYPKSIHYELLHKDKKLFFCIHCEDEKHKDQMREKFELLNSILCFNSKNIFILNKEINMNDIFDTFKDYFFKTMPIF